MAAGPPVCRDLVELVTDSLDGALEPAVQAAVADHLHGCAGCAEYVNQVRATVDRLAALPDQPLDPKVCDRLMTAFRDWNPAA